MFTVALFTISNVWDQPKWPLIDKWVKKISHTHTHIGILAIKNDICHFDNMGRPRGYYYAKWNKSGREGQILYDFTYMWN